MTIPSPIRVGPFCGESLIGEGSFASVWRAFHVSTQLPVAIKVVPKTSVDSEAAQTHLIREITLMRQINHPFIASLFHVSEDSTNYYLVMEFADCGSLRDRINLLGQLNETESRHYFCELVWVIEYLHSETHIAHRDLKCENILFDRYDNIRVIDFGLSRVCDKRETMLTVCGSPAYTAPEIIQSQPYTKAADIWSLGVVLYGMTVGYLSFNHQDVPILLRMIVNDTISYPDRLTPALRDLLQRLLRKEPDKRIGLEEIKSHPWFSLNEYSMMVKEVHDELGHLIFDSSHSGVLDPEVLAKMSELGVDTKQLGQAILQRTATDGTLVYDILRRNLLAEKTQEVIKRIQQGMSGNVHGEKMPRRTTATLVRPIGAVNVRRNSKPSENVGTGLWEPRFGMKRLSKQPLRVPHIPTPRPTGELM